MHLILSILLRFTPIDINAILSGLTSYLFTNSFLVDSLVVNTLSYFLIDTLLTNLFNVSVSSLFNSYTVPITGAWLNLDTSVVYIDDERDWISIMS